MRRSTSRIRCSLLLLCLLLPVAAWAADTTPPLHAAVRSYLPRAQDGDAGAQYELGLLYSEGRSVPRDPAEALRWFRLAAEQDHAKAQFHMGVIFDQGRGVEKDLSRAADWFRKAALRGVPEAQFNLAAMYALGEGVAQDDGASRLWTWVAAEHGVAKAQYNLGLAFEQGRGVAQDETLGLMWLGQAIAQGFPPALIEGNRLAESLSEEELERARSLGKSWQRKYTAGSDGAGTPRPIDDALAEPAYRPRSPTSVVVLALIGRDGKVGDARALESRPADPAFERAAVRAVLRRRFTPAERDGEPVAVFHTVVVEAPQR
ncbi:MAG: TonB family protein [bacterium]|nr:TonB family protein [bacterium]